MKGPHYGLVVSATSFNHSTGFVVAIPITSKAKVSTYEFRVQQGRVDGNAILSEPRALDYTTREIAYEDHLPAFVMAAVNKRIREIFPV